MQLFLRFWFYLNEEQWFRYSRLMSCRFTRLLDRQKRCTGAVTYLSWTRYKSILKFVRLDLMREIYRWFDLIFRFEYMIKLAEIFVQALYFFQYLRWEEHRIQHISALWLVTFSSSSYWSSKPLTSCCLNIRTFVLVEGYFYQVVGILKKHISYAK